jgi:hypothetical protein
LTFRNDSQTESLLTKSIPFNESSINEEFREEFKRLENEARELDLSFQDLVKDMKIWIAASLGPVTEEVMIK